MCKTVARRAFARSARTLLRASAWGEHASAREQALACRQCFAQVAGQSGARKRRRAGRAVARQGVHACRRAQGAGWLAGRAGVCVHARGACSARAHGVRRTRAGRLARCCRPLSSCPRCLTAHAPRPARQPGASPRVEAGQGAAPGLSHAARGSLLVRAAVLCAHALRL